MVPTVTHPQSTKRLTRTVPEVADILGLSARLLYEAVVREEIRAVKVGERVVVPVAEVERLLGHPLPEGM